jgi:hypothetical protein
VALVVFKRSTLRLSCALNFNFSLCSHSGYRVYATNVVSTFTCNQQSQTLQRLLYYSFRGRYDFKGTEWCHVAVPWNCFSQPTVSFALNAFRWGFCKVMLELFVFKGGRFRDITRVVWALEFSPSLFWTEPTAYLDRVVRTEYSVSLYS